MQVTAATPNENSQDNMAVKTLCLNFFCFILPICLIRFPLVFLMQRGEQTERLNFTIPLLNY